MYAFKNLVSEYTLSVLDFAANYDVITPYMPAIIMGVTAGVYESMASYKRRAGITYHNIDQTKLNIVGLLTNRTLSNYRTAMRTTLGVTVYWITGMLSPWRTYFIADQIYNSVQQSPYQFYDPQKTLAPFFYPNFVPCLAVNQQDPEGSHHQDKFYLVYGELLETYHHAYYHPIEYHYPEEYDSTGKYQLIKNPFTESIMAIPAESIWSNIRFGLGLLEFSQNESALTENPDQKDKEYLDRNCECFEIIKQFQIKRYSTPKQKNILQLSIPADMHHAAKELQSLSSYLAKLSADTEIVIAQEWTTTETHQCAVSLLKNMRNINKDIFVRYQDFNPKASIPNNLSQYANDITTIGFDNVNLETSFLNTSGSNHITHLSLEAPKATWTALANTVKAFFLSEFQEEVFLFSIDRLSAGKNIALFLSPSEGLQLLKDFGNVGWKLTVLPVKMLFLGIGAAYLYFTKKNKTLFELHGITPDGPFITHRRPLNKHTIHSNDRNKHSAPQSGEKYVPKTDAPSVNETGAPSVNKKKSPH
ncbi:MAG: hypothetical protein FJ161_03500 [Gammaproteobacteria bacterium]|nr:hypothetical protein [Gammaproteobacteria bacterium]